MNNIIETLKNHASIRKFNDEQITKDEENEIIKSAMQGATAGNMMQYSIIKIRDKDVLEKLSVICDEQPFIAKADLALLFLVDSYKYNEYFKLREIDKKFEGFKGPSAVDYTLGMQDSIIAAQNAVVAAESLDIGTCYIGDVLENIEQYQEMFNLPEFVVPSTMVVFGKYDYKPKVRDRFKEEFVVFEEKYPDIDDNFIEKMFEEREKVTSDYAEKLYGRKMNAPFFQEMIRSIENTIKKWIK